MQITNFQDLLQAATQQSEPQRLLMVFTGAALPAGASAAQRAEFEAGHGGELTPLMCVEKRPEDIQDFNALIQEAAQFAQSWQILFATSLSGKAGQPPSSEQANAGLDKMLAAVKAGQLGAFISFDRRGEAVSLQAQ